jgi:hypothetical protein
MTATLPLERLLELEGTDIGATFGGEVQAGSLKLGDMTYFTELDGDAYWSVNAFHNGTNWMRVDVAKPAWLFQFNVDSLMVFESYRAWTFWIASAAANPIGAVATVGGWELAASMSQYRDWTLGGGGMEVDGHATVEEYGYGRFQHATITGVAKTGLLVNSYLDESGRDRPLKPSWQCGFQSDGATDRFVLSRAAGGVSWPGWTELLTVSAAGVLAHVGNATVGGTLGVTGAATLSSTLGVTGVATLSGNATVGGTLGVTGAATLSSTLGVTGVATLSGNASVGGTLGVTGAATMSSTLGVTGAITSAGSTVLTKTAAPATLSITIDGGGSAITAGAAADIEIPFACEISSAKAFADQSGSVSVDFLRAASGVYPPVTSLVAAAPLALSAASSGTATITTWTKTLAAGDIVRPVTSGVATITRLTISLTLTRT